MLVLTSQLNPSEVDLKRVETNRIRGGMCLVLAEGLSQKAPKLWKRLSVWGHEFKLDWDFLEEFLALQKKVKAKDNKDVSKLAPNYTFISDLVAGRPVITHPMAFGGLRLRYGRSRVSGFSAASINPATMHLLSNFIATGTQLKMERPGKAASITPCDTVDGPIIRTIDGSVIKIRNAAQAKKYKESLEKILFLGDVLFSYGDFSENGHALVPAGYNEDWWQKDFEKTVVNMFGTLDPEKVSEQTGLVKERTEELLFKPLKKVITATEAIRLSEKLDVPLHPEYTYFWRVLSAEDLQKFIKLIREGKTYPEKMVLGMSLELKQLLEAIGLPHKVASNEFIVIEGSNAFALLKCIGKGVIDPKKNAIENLEILSGLKIKDKAGTFVGARMGRPEKAKMRKLSGSPQVLFPIGAEGGRLRSFQAAMEAGRVTAELPMYRCESCNKETIWSVCEECHKKTKKLYLCSHCGLLEEDHCMHGPAYTYRKQEIDICQWFALDVMCIP